MHQQIFCAALEKVFNKALSLNIHGLSGLAPLEQKTLTVYLDEFAFPLSFSIDQQNILVTTLVERSDCQLKTSVSSLIELKKEQQITELIKQEKLDILGDIKVAQQFASLFENLSIDWQSEFAEHIGDIPTYKLSQFSLWLREKINFAAEQIQADASEWLVHEKRLAVTKGQLLSFNQQVDDVANDVLMIEKKIERLLTKITNRAKI
ncbi:MAG: SCP2 sterol-binding domain-containing protein [Colwelliaceae bacterium]|jgi:ubiquinone biosynthesis protein UbiJ|nr:SCP2 sterol-binding domain-containing protein [Colwelliaceae bacterium]